MRDIVTGAKSVEAARQYYAKEFLDSRRKEPTPYMDELRFPRGDGDAADPDRRILSDEDLSAAAEKGERR